MASQKTASSKAFLNSDLNVAEDGELDRSFSARAEPLARALGCDGVPLPNRSVHGHGAVELRASCSGAMAWRQASLYSALGGDGSGGTVAERDEACGRP